MSDFPLRKVKRLHPVHVLRARSQNYFAQFNFRLKLESKFELGISVKWKNIKTEHEIKIVRAEETESISSCFKMMY